MSRIYLSNLNIIKILLYNFTKTYFFTHVVFVYVKVNI